jgi:hypothetical protein
MTHTAAAKTLTGAADVECHHLRAFGLDLESDFPLTGSRPGPPTGGTRLGGIGSTEMSEACTGAAAMIFEPSYPDGLKRFVVERDELNYRLWFVDEGRFLVSLDGRTVLWDADAVHGEALERILFAQVIPFVAAVQGYEVLHASAVEISGVPVAFTGSPGVGKTTLASWSVMSGAAFVTDDVLAVSLEAGELLCHSGPPLMVLDRPSFEPEELGEVVGETDKVHVSVRARESKHPLGALFHLERGTREIELSPLEPDASTKILASFFVSYLMTPERLARHLEIARLVSATVAQYRLRVPRGADREAVVETVRAQIERGRA